MFYTLREWTNVRLSTVQTRWASNQRIASTEATIIVVDYCTPVNLVEQWTAKL